MSWPVLPLREHERPLTRLPKATFTFGLGPTVWLHEAIEYSAHKLIRQRKYFCLCYLRLNFVRLFRSCLLDLQPGPGLVEVSAGEGPLGADLVSVQGDAVEAGGPGQLQGIPQRRILQQVVACFTTSRARKAIDQATHSYFYFWPRSNRLASRGPSNTVHINL